MKILSIFYPSFIDILGVVLFYTLIYLFYKYILLFNYKIKKNKNEKAIKSQQDING
jgi:predicted membrane protein